MEGLASSRTSGNLLTGKFRVLWTLVLREVLMSFRVSRSGYLLVMAEPVFQFLLMYLIFSLVQRSPAFGADLGLFLATGIIPYFMFMHMTSRVSRAVRGSRSFARVPRVGPLDVAIAKGVLEFLTLIVFATAVLSILYTQGQPAIPRNPVQLIHAILMITATAFGLGMVNGVLAHKSRVYLIVYGVFSKSALFFSGIFYVPATLPQQARDMLFYNPIIHGVEWFRTGIFMDYPAYDLDTAYLGGWAVGTLTLGVVLIRSSEGRLVR